MAFPLVVETRTEAITSGVNQLISRGGIRAATTRAVATEVGLSVGTLANHLNNKERVLQVCGATAARRWVTDIEDRVG